MDDMDSMDRPWTMDDMLPGCGTVCSATPSIPSIVHVVHAPQAGPCCPSLPQPPEKPPRRRGQQAMPDIQRPVPQIEQVRRIDLPGAQAVFRRRHINAGIEVDLAELLPGAAIAEQITFRHDLLDEKIDGSTAGSLPLNQLRSRQRCVLHGITPCDTARRVAYDDLTVFDEIYQTETQFRFGQTMPALAWYEVQRHSFRRWRQSPQFAVAGRETYGHPC